MRHVYECQLRWADMDQLRHINNVTYADYLQEARIDMFRALQLRVGSRPTTPGDEERFGMIVVGHEITYRAPLHFDFRPAQVEMWITEVRAASFVVAYDIYREGQNGDRQVFLSATTRISPFVFGSARPRRLTDLEKTALADFLEAPDEKPERTPRPPAARRTRAGHYPVHVRFSDLDPFGHVNNVTYLEYFQEGRILFNGRLWRDLPEGTPRVDVVVARADFDYVRPMVSQAGGYDLWTWVERVGRTSVVMGAEIHDPHQPGVVMARARVVLVFVDLETNRSTEPPDGYRDPMVAALEMPDDPGAVTRTS